MSKNSSLSVIIRFSSLGDIVLCSAFCSKLAQCYPQDQSVFITSSQSLDVLRSFQSQPHQILGFKGSSGSFFFQALKWIQSEHKKTPVDRVKIYDLHRVPKSFFTRIGIAVFCLFKGIPFEIRATPKKNFRRWLSVFLRKDMLGPRHIYAEHLKLLPKSPQSLEQLPQLQSRNTEHPVTKILIAPDSQHWKKKWPISHWEQLLNLIVEHLDCELTLVGGSHIFPQDIIDQLPHDRIKNRLGLLPLSDLSRIASEHNLTICGNSAWQHISESVDVPVISLAGPIISGFGFSPFLKNSVELSVPLKCRPCTRHGDGLCDQLGEAYHACMTHIRPEKVFAEIKKILESSHS